LRPYCGRTYAGIEVMREAIHETADGKRFLVIHGDQFDGVIKFAKWLAHLGSWAYDRALQANEMLHRLRHMLGFPYWSLSAWLKHAVKDAVEYVCRFEDAVAQAAELHGLDGVVCGHIHQAQIRQIGNVLYLNDGDWVESCTALVEDAGGHLEIVRWTAAVSTPAQFGTARQVAAVPA
jgi:UDP-2,3-diacylglucosamine pyrophosphatase LpxH